MKAIVLAMAMLAGTAASAAPPEYFPSSALPGGVPAPFSSAVRVGDMVYLSGQIGITPEGKLSPNFDEQAKQTMDNIGAILKSRKLRFADLVKCTVMLDDIKDWPAFNRVYMTYFKPGRMPARSAFGADGLALGAKVEVECWAYAGKR